MGHGYTFPRRGPVGLHDGGVITVRAHICEGRGLAVECLEAGRWYACVAHKLLGENLRALYAGRRPRRTEDLQAGLPERLGDASYQGGFGTDDGEVDTAVGGVVS